MRAAREHTSLYFSYTATVALRGVTGVFSGTGSSKKSAQEEAASQILDSMRTQGQMNDEEVWKT